MAMLLLENARVHTMIGADPVPPAPAILLEGARVVAAGAGHELAAALGPGDRRIDLGGRTVVPGFIDAHMHLMWFSFNLDDVHLDGVRSLAAALDEVRAKHRLLPPGAWMRGWGFNANRWERWPTRHDLDAICPDRPVLLNSKDGHTGWANTRALELAGIHARTPEPTGGRILRDAHGEPVGLLKENAIALVLRAVPARSEDETAAALRQGMQAAHAVGCTAVHDLDGSRCFAALQHLRSQGDLRLRVVEYLQEDALEPAIAAGVRTGLGDRWLRVGGIKLFSDGALGSQTAWMLDDWLEQPGYRGLPVHTPDELRVLIGRCVQHGLACAVHAIGDAANRMILDVHAEYQPASRQRGLRHRIEHAQHLNATDIPRFAALGVVASVQPSHAPSDRELVQRYLGADRSKSTYAFAALLAAGARLACGSDAPVEALNPLAGIYAAVCRRHPGETADPFNPTEALTPYQALLGFTAGAAWAGGMEQVHGSLAPGHAADLVILSHDPLSGREEDLLACQVDATMLDGSVVYGNLP